MTFTKKEMAAILACAYDLMYCNGRSDEEWDFICEELRRFKLSDSLYEEICEIARGFKNRKYFAMGMWLDCGIYAIRRPGDVKDETLDVINEMTTEQKLYVSGFLITLAHEEDGIDDDECLWWQRWAECCDISEYTKRQAHDYWMSH